MIANDDLPAIIVNPSTPIATFGGRTCCSPTCWRTSPRWSAARHRAGAFPLADHAARLCGRSHCADDRARAVRDRGPAAHSDERARQASPALAVVLLRHAHIVVAIRTFRLVACDLDLCRLIFAGQLCSLRGLGERRGLRYGRLRGLRNYGCRHRRRWHGLRCGNFRWRYSLLRQALRIIAKPQWRRRADCDVSKHDHAHKYGADDCKIRKEWH